jgi:hypothetical protein
MIHESSMKKVDLEKDGRKTDDEFIGIIQIA